MKPLVSIIVPVYNVEKYIDSCIISIITQTYENLQVILVDDGTPDNSGKICDEYAKKDERISVIHKENGGQSSGRNAGLDIANGDYIMFVDSDDYIACNAVEILVRAIIKYDADFVQFNMVHTANMEYSKKHIAEEYNIELLEDLEQMYWKMFKTVGAGESACTKLYKNSMFDELRFKEGIIYEDVYFNLIMLQKVRRALYIDIGPYYYVIRPNSTITSSFSKKKLDSIWVLEERINEFKKLGFIDLENYAREKYFFQLTNLWCLAKQAKDRESLKIIEEKIRKFKKNSEVRFSKKIGLIYNLCKVNVGLLYFYYLYKKITKQM